MKTSQQPFETKHGPTRKLDITEIIRPGGECQDSDIPFSMKSKKYRKKDIGVEISDNRTELACLLWMGDVLLMETKQQENQILLNITNKVAEKYHIKFGKEKS